MISAPVEPLWITSRSKVLVESSISARDTSLAGLPVEMAITKDSEVPIETDWVLAQWINNRATVLVGPLTSGASIELEPREKYWVWVRVETGVEKPELFSGPLCTF